MQETMSELEEALDAAKAALDRIKKLDKKGWFDTVFAAAYDQLQKIRLRNAVWYGIHYDPEMKRLIGPPAKEDKPNG